MALLLFGFNAAAELWALNRSPDLTAKLLAAVLLAAALAGLAFRGRVFCRFWCPVGGMIALTSRLAPVEVGSREPGGLPPLRDQGLLLRRDALVPPLLVGLAHRLPVQAPGVPGVHLPPRGRGGRRTA